MIVVEIAIDDDEVEDTEETEFEREEGYVGVVDIVW